MKNKTYKKFIEISLIILFGAIIIGVIVFIANPFSQPEFKIYEEVCTIDEELYDMFQANDVLTITPEKNVKSYNIKIELENDYELEEITGLRFSPRVRLSFTTCEKVEVDEMYIENQTVGSCSKWREYDDNTARCIGEEEEWEEEIWLFNYELSVDWLDENYECIKEDIPERSGDFDLKDAINGKFKCLEYRYENYVVEVNE